MRHTVEGNMVLTP